ncbi:MAG: hypothetical protein V7771_15150 [Shewanella psychromarinicola]|jgi:hypothetical protein|uniref:hypothetical protein n=1 Tax=Shewanella TaxID=22 RepID=UPI0013E3EC22|nr:hypothetical protein [Shewanella psychromarinicola]MCL1082035.1 hypothetical protein [Shewanella psychromarinicola]
MKKLCVGILPEASQTRQQLLLLGTEVIPLSELWQPLTYLEILIMVFNVHLPNCESE